MELVDIVDENNKLTGQVEERTLAHKKSGFATCHELCSGCLR